MCFVGKKLKSLNTLMVSTHTTLSPNFKSTMYEPTYLLVFFALLFTTMSAIFALAAFGGYTAPNRSAWEKAFSFGLGLFCSIGFARLAIESAGRI